MKKRNSRYQIGLIILFFIGLSILLYPMVSDAWNRHRAKLLMSNYDKNVATVDPLRYEQEKEIARAYNETLVGDAVPDAFAVREDVQDAVYESMLNVGGDSIMGYVDIPSADIRIPIYHYTFESVLQKGAGHLFGSSLPVGGTGTHATITAHRGLPSAKLFTDLNYLEVGNCFYLHILDEVLAYEVDDIATVLPSETERLAIYPDKDLVTLVTCTPYGVNSHRLLVTGHRVPYSEETEETGLPLPQQIVKKGPQMLGQVLSMLAGVAVAVLITKLADRKSGRKKRNIKDSES
ncbi:MAG: class C sortase [Lachnospiraceae bacterium]|nr:class C sortase [Lachnospiraceae bacterium]